MTINDCTIEEINELREIKKLLNILQTYGNVVVSGGYHAISRFQFLVSRFVDKGITTDDVSSLIDSLDVVGYPFVKN